MIRIAICDDDTEFGNRILKLVENCFRREHTFGNYHIFNNSKALLYEVDESNAKFELLLLDIEMPQMDGIELTKRLRIFLPDVLIIFITSYEKYVYKSFKVQPYRFIPKDQLEEMLPEALSDAIAMIKNQEGKFYIAKNQRGIEKVLQKTITHIWHAGKYAYIEKTYGETTKVRSTLKDIYRNLDSNMFEWIDRGCICNLAQIMKIVDDNVILTDGTKLQISQDRVPSLKARLREYLIQQEKTW